jgi:hypothetical protein
MLDVDPLLNFLSSKILFGQQCTIGDFFDSMYATFQNEKLQNKITLYKQLNPAYFEQSLQQLDYPNFLALVKTK